MIGQQIDKLDNDQGRVVEVLAVDVPGCAVGVEVFRIVYLSDGLRVNGYLLRSVGGSLWPGIVYNRGGVGDSNKVDDTQLAYLSLLVAEGYVVVATQYRGNDGSEGREDYLGGDVEDVFHIFELLRSLEYVDGERVGMLGFSRGAAVAYQALKRGIGVKAACVMGCSTDFVDAYSVLPHYQPFLRYVFDGTPESNPGAYISRSPLYWPEKINVPLLIIQGTDDHHVPIHQVHQLADKLKALGKVYELVVYPHGDHELNKVGEDKDRRILEWFGKYL